MSIKLRHFTRKDEISLAHHADNPNVGRYLRDRFPSPFTLLDARWWIEEGHCAEGNLNFAVDLDGICIGSIGITFSGDSNCGQAEIGFWIGEQYWRKGYTALAISELITYLTENTDFNTIVAHVAAPNIASMKVLEKAGFSLSRVNKNAAEVKAGIFDQHVYHLTIENPS
ncbi:GNAT family N-acetyltransferase [Aurantivibrio infirmus]